MFAIEYYLISSRNGTIGKEIKKIIGNSIE
jgi:hypothetical protein